MGILEQLELNIEMSIARIKLNPHLSADLNDLDGIHHYLLRETIMCWKKEDRFLLLSTRECITKELYREL